MNISLCRWGKSWVCWSTILGRCGRLLLSLGVTIHLTLLFLFGLREGSFLMVSAGRVGFRFIGNVSFSSWGTSSLSWGLSLSLSLSRLLLLWEGVIFSSRAPFSFSFPPCAGGDAVSIGVVIAGVGQHFKPVLCRYTIVLGEVLLVACLLVLLCCIVSFAVAFACTEDGFRLRTGDVDAMLPA